MTRASRPGYRAVLFDFDGTLTPSLPLWVKAYHIAFEQCGISLTDEEIVSRCFFRDWHLVAQDVGVESGEKLERLVIGVGIPKAFAEAVLFPRAKHLIEHCREHGLRTALVTTAPRSMISEVIPRLELHELFDFTVCSDDVANYKPHPEPLFKALTALDCAPAEAIMVGDSRVDMLAGKAAGTATALFLPPGPNRFHSIEALHATEPDHIFADHAELPPLLGLPQLRMQASGPQE
jgi:HAD superfamily hydrolase (TIGR01509 family)